MPHTLSDTERDLLQRYIGLCSERHGEPYVRESLSDPEGWQREIWYLVAYCLGTDQGEAVRDLLYAYDTLSPDAARAAWLFINAYPRVAAQLERRHTFGARKQEKRQMKAALTAAPE